MTSPYLPDDCVYCILKYLQHYRSTLFNCLLVNRFWCKAAVPLLYADPFLYGLCADYKKRPSIITTLILFLNKTEILQLKNQLKQNDINNIINNEHKPLFEYPKYLENFDYYGIKSTVLYWIRSNILLFDFDLQIDVCECILSIFHKSILSQCNNIKRLRTPLCVLYNWNVQTIKTITSKLNSLTISLDFQRIDNEISTEFLKNLGNVCLNLKKFEILPGFFDSSINVNDFKENLCKIIQKQNNLEVIKLKLPTYYRSFLDGIFLALEFQKHSLVDVEFTHIDFGNISNISFKSFINLCNLKYLKFNECCCVSLDKCEILQYASFKLKRLEFNENSGLITSLMIKYLGASLQELKIYEILDLSIFKNISIYCLNLITLEIKIDRNIDLLILPYFKNLGIRILIIYSWGNIDNMLFNILANNLSINIKEVSFPIYRRSHFKEFLENCHNFLEVIGINSPIESAFLEIILDYIERDSSGNLKCLGVTKLEKELDDEELKLINQIKSKGVKIVDFYSICKPAVYY